MLEIAAGTGVLTRELVAAIPAAEVTATDLNAAMVEFGSRRALGAAWQQADALHLPFADKRFDLVVCQFGVMFVPDKPAAFREMRRVLAPEGRLLFSTWSTVDTHGFAAALVAGVERAFPDDPPMFVTAVPHGYSDVGQAVADLAAGGLECVSTESVTLDGRSGSAAEVAVGFCTGTPLRMAIEDRGDLLASTAVVSEEMARRLGDGPVTSKMTAYIIGAQPRAINVPLTTVTSGTLRSLTASPADQVNRADSQADSPSPSPRAPRAMIRNMHGTIFAAAAGNSPTCQVGGTDSPDTSGGGRAGFDMQRADASGRNLDALGVGPV